MIETYVKVGISILVGGSSLYKISAKLGSNTCRYTQHCNNNQTILARGLTLEIPIAIAFT